MAGVQAGSAGSLNIQVIADIARLQQDMARAEKIIRQVEGAAASSGKGMEGSFNRAGTAATKMAADAQRAAVATTGLVNPSRLAGHHMQNLAFQANDVAVSLAGGQKPMTVFMQQGSQIAQIMMQAGVGLGGVVRQVGAMVGAFLIANPLLLAAAAAAGVIAAGIGLVTEEINKSSKVTVTWSDVLLGTFDVIKGAIGDKVTSSFKAMGLDIGDVWETVKKYTKAAINFIIATSTAVPQMIMAVYDKLPAAFGDAFYSAANLAIEALNKLAQMSAAPLNLIIGGFNRAFGTQIPEIVIGGIAKIANPYSGAMSALGSAAAKSFVGSFTKDYIGDFADAVSTAAQKRARLREAAEKGGKDVGGKVGKAAAKAAGEAFGDDFALELIRSLGKYAGDVRKTMQPIVEALNAAQIEGLSAKLRKVQDEATRAGREAAEASQKWNADLRDTVDLLDQIGGMASGMGSVLAGIYGTRTGDFSGVPGPAGSLLTNLLTTRDQDGNRALNKIGVDFRDALDSVFGGNGKFFQALQGATTGSAIGSIMGGGQGTQIGATAGGALGQVFGEKFLTKGLNTIMKGLGDFAGPLGSIVGSIAGGLLGGLFKKVKSGYAQIRPGADGSSVTGTYGRTGDLKGGATTAANALIDTIKNIATQLGGTLGGFDLDIGRKDDKFVVNGGAAFGTNSFATEEEAMRFAISVALSKGAVQGIRDTTQNILKSGKALEAALQDALAFEGVFSELQKIKDPAAYAAGQLDKELANLKRVFEQAGASAAEYAQLEELYQLKRKDLIEQGNADALELERTRRQMEIQLMELSGDTVGALAAVRQLEMDALDSSLHALAQEIYAKQDSVRVAEEAARAAEELRKAWQSVGDSLMDEVNRIRGLTGGSGASFAQLQGQFNAAVTSARGGDMEAAKKLVDLSQSLISVAGNTATSRQELERIKAQTAASLEGVNGLIGAFTGTNDVSSAALSSLTPQPANDASAAEIRSVRDEMAGMRSDLNNALATIASNTGRTARKWDDVTQASGGDAISVANAA